MKKRTNDDETVEAAAFVVTDPLGRRRVFIGDLAPEGEPWRPGVAIYDEDGSERVSLLLGDVGPVLSYAADGDTRLELGVVDPHRGGTEPGPFLVVVGPEGETAWSVGVNDQGLVRAG